MNVGSVVTAVKDIALAIAAIITATVAVRGLQKWREEIRGKADFEVARNLARSIYRLRDEIQSCRSPFIRGSEFPPGYQSSTNNPQLEAQAWAHVYKNRWEPVTKALQEFDSQALEGEALWGAEIRDQAQKLRKCAHTLFVAIEAIIEDKAAAGGHFKADPNFGKRMRATVSASAAANDNALSNEIAAAVGELEANLRRHLTR